MKKITLLTSLLGIVFGMKAQITELSNGNVGIGTTNPHEILEVASGQTNGLNPPIIRLSNKDINAAPNQLLGEIQFFNSDLDGPHISSYIKAIAADLYGRRGQLAFGTNEQNANNAVERMRIDQNGNVGIGTTTPSAKLQIEGNVILKDFLSVETSLGKSRLFAHHLQLGRNSANYIQANASGGYLRFVVNGNILSKYAMQISANGDVNFSNGNVGIGTTTTGSHKLAVEGSIGAREIKVEANGWSDFVFYDDYKLPTLKEVENHIKEKGHLKDIPSAEEVEKEGFFLGEMDSKLLQKIEELTLYTIQQQKEIERLKLIEKRLYKIEKLLESKK